MVLNKIERDTAWLNRANRRVFEKMLAFYVILWLAVWKPVYIKTIGATIVLMCILWRNKCSTFIHSFIHLRKYYFVFVTAMVILSLHESSSFASQNQQVGVDFTLKNFRLTQQYQANYPLSDWKFVNTLPHPYSPSGIAQWYEDANFDYFIDNQQLIQISLKDSSAYLTATTRKTTEDLQILAEMWLEKLYGESDPQNFSYSNNHKENEVYFYRWSDPENNQKFIQITLSYAGELIGYVNASNSHLALMQGQRQEVLIPDMQSSVLSFDFNEVYVNDGAYWSIFAGSMNIANNTGYCYVESFCSIKYSRYANTYYSTGTPTYTVAGRWTPNYSNEWNWVYAYIPSTYATAYAFYDIYHSKGKDTQWINQFSYGNVFVLVSKKPYTGITKIELTNQSLGGSTRLVNWDEIWVVNLYDVYLPIIIK